MSIEFDDCYSHDDNDNLQMDAESNSYAYDYRNRLIEVQNNESATIAEYTFDALGRRIKKVVDGVTTYFFYDTSNRVIAEYEGETPELTKEFVYGNGVNEVLAMFLAEYEGSFEDWQEFLGFAEAWLSGPNDANWNNDIDVVDDDRINFEDFAYFASQWNMPSNTETRFYLSSAKTHLTVKMNELHDPNGSELLFQK